MPDNLTHIRLRRIFDSHLSSPKSTSAKLKISMSTAFVITSQNTLTFRCGQVQRLAIHLAAELSLNNCPCYQKKRYTICTYLSPSDPDKARSPCVF